MNTMATKQIVQSGWAKVGIWPPNPRNFASRWALWDQLSNNEQDYFMDCCHLIAIQMINGTADGIDTNDVIQGTQCDTFAKNLLFPLLGELRAGVNNTPVKEGNQITNLSLHRWRFTFLTSQVRTIVLKRKEEAGHEIPTQNQE